ncbi:MAG: hypothetical protein ACREUU_01845 [Gammaproteobacteria bacterium]
MDLHRIGIKFFAEESSAVDLPEFIPVFHRWIQGKLLDEMLIDVADYSHVRDGPGILLVAHAGNYAYDETGGKRGLVYYSKHVLQGSLSDRIATVGRRALAACALIESDETLRGRVRFRGDRVEIFANDRLLAPNTEQTWKTLRPALEDSLKKLFADAEYSLETEPDPVERFSVMASAKQPASIAELIQRLGSSG